MTKTIDSFEEVVPKLVKIQLFSDFSPEDEKDKEILKNVCEIMKLKEFKKDEVIIEEGKFGEDFFILYRGTVRVCRKTPAGDTIALADLKSEDNIFFGETALISDEPRTATVKALSDCLCISLSSKAFLSLCEKEPLLGYRVIFKLAKRIAKTLRDTNNDKATLYAALFSEIEEGF